MVRHRLRPLRAGSYTVVGTVSNANYTGTATGTLVISKAPATVTLGNLAQTYTGSPLAASATTNPSRPDGGIDLHRYKRRYVWSLIDAANRAWKLHRRGHGKQ